MNPVPELNDKHISDYAIALLAGIGGLARYLNTYLRGGGFDKWRLLAHVCVAAFSGYLFGHLAVSGGLSYDWVLIGAGLGGWLGPGAIDLLLDTFKKTLK